jgi:hypothetical protein
MEEGHTPEPQTQPKRRPDTGIASRFASLGAAEQTATVGALVILGSLLLPWYGLKLISRVSQTGLDAFGWGQAALALTAAGALVVILRGTRGRRLPRPLAEGPLLVLAGAWSAVLVGYLMLDRPDAFDPLKVTLRYGIWVAMGGAVVLIMGGLRLAREQREPHPDV